MPEKKPGSLVALNIFLKKEMHYSSQYFIAYPF